MPAKDLEQSKRFYVALGFENVLDGPVAIFNAGSGGFILQPYTEDEWARHCMMQLMVDDLDAWWAHHSMLGGTPEVGRNVRVARDRNRVRPACPHIRNR